MSNKTMRYSRSMVILALLGVGISLNLTSKEFEEQRKYIATSESHKLEQLFSSGGQLNGMQMVKHAVYQYYDIYLDTSDWLLFKEGYSLRLRRRAFEDGTVEYGFQLKSEMTHVGALRMEIEEVDLVKYYQIEKVKLTKLIDQLIGDLDIHLQANPTRAYQVPSGSAEAVGMIIKWIHFKLGAAVGPFQELRQLFQSIHSLKPVIIGRSNRVRSHIYVDPKRTIRRLEDLAPSLKPAVSIPPTVPAGTIYIMEASYDHANFYSLDDVGQGGLAMAAIVEFEIENKYAPAAIGSELLGQFEHDLTAMFPVKTGLESKYWQAIQILGLGPAQK